VKSLPVINSCNSCGACCEEMGGTPVAWYLGKPEREVAVRMALAVKEGLELKQQQFDCGNLEGIPSWLIEEMRHQAEEWKTKNTWPTYSDPCTWYDPISKRCKNYDYRPLLCRAFELGSSACRRVRRIAGVDPTIIIKFIKGKMVKVLKCVDSRKQRMAGVDQEVHVKEVLS